ncbi:hypothetical protein JL721_3926 [Aureococcus anophagefferens]|nr:hypothetical protein JL721_3926 [Aureococcus anophagefferens]
MDAAVAAADALLADEAPPELGVDGRRWPVCLLMLAMGSLQASGWMVFSASDAASRAAFGLGSDGSLVLDWFMNVGTICFVLALPLFGKLLRRLGPTRGRHAAVSVAGWHGAALSSALRCVAVYARGAPWAVPLAFVACAVNGAVAPGFYYGSAVAEVWFPETERFLALAILAIPGTVGPLLAFGPRRPSRSGCSGGVGARQPARPPPPRREFRGAKGAETLLPACGAAVWTLGLAAGASSGFFQVWTDSIADALHASTAVSERQTQAIGLVANLGNLVGGLLVGPVVVSLGLARRLKAVLLACLLLGLAGYVAFALAMPFGARAASAVTVLGGCPFWALAAFVAAASASVGATFPVFYDLAAELDYPRDPAPSAAAINYCLNGIQVLFMAALPFVPAGLVSGLMAAVSVLCLALVGPVPASTYARLDEDERARRAA